MDNFLADERADFAATVGQRAGADLAARLTPDRQVGDLLKLDYGEAVVVVHDYLKAKVGGLPLGTFLVASRLAPGSEPDPAQEDTSLILLRVLGPAPLPDVSETEMMRFNAAQRSIASEHRWDDKGITDQITLNLLRHAGLRCRILGTFLLRKEGGEWPMVFGPDLANFYSGRGMKVYKPHHQTLAEIVNFVRLQGDEQHPAAGHRIRVGRVRYAASEREGDDTGEVAVVLDPTDLLARRTALFGMSRTGKSNTTKVIAAAVFRLRGRENGVRVGQLILDPNGEYANDNAQDAGSSLRGVARTTPSARPDDVVTYGLHSHPNDPARRIVKLNFFGNEPQNWRDRDEVEMALVGLIQGKEIFDTLLADQITQYMSDFRALRLDVPLDWDDSTRTRYQRLISAYRSLLSGHLKRPASMDRANVARLINADLLTALSNSPKYASVSGTFGQDDVHWDQARDGWRLLGQAINDQRSGYSGFNQTYRGKHGGRDWHDAPLMTVFDYLDHQGGMKLISRLAEYHSPDTTTDYAEDVITDLRAGRLVIVDQSTGNPDMNKAAAERLMWRVFNRQKQDFVDPPRDEHGEVIRDASGRIPPPPDILIYVEEAHNLLPAKSDDLTTVWARTAKEGSKFRIGLAYATQEPSSIQANILKNTDNWFVAHLNNTDELRELKKYYDFEDFAQQILTVPEPGFLRMRTLSNPYVVPVQVDRFRTDGSTILEG